MLGCNVSHDQWFKTFKSFSDKYIQGHKKLAKWLQAQVYHYLYNITNIYLSHYDRQHVIYCGQLVIVASTLQMTWFTSNIWSWCVCCRPQQRKHDAVPTQWPSILEITTIEFRYIANSNRQYYNTITDKIRGCLSSHSPDSSTLQEWVQNFGSALYAVNSHSWISRI